MLNFYLCMIVPQNFKKYKMLYAKGTCSLEYVLTVLFGIGRQTYIRCAKLSNTHFCLGIS